MPIQTYFFNHFVMASFFIGSYNDIKENDHVDHYSRKNVESVKTSNKEEEIGKQSVSIFIVDQVGPFDYLNSILNFKTALFGALSIFIYTCIYTPLKAVTPLSVFVGAFPGAIPFMLGWVAATGSFGIEPGILFMVQFFWQFPHFWAIGWMMDNDYKKAGFKMLPTGKPDKATAFQIVFYTLWTLIIPTHSIIFLALLCLISNSSMAISIYLKHKLFEEG